VIDVPETHQQRAPGREKSKHADDPSIYLSLRLQNLRLTDNQFGWIVPLDTARRLRDQLTEHLDAAQWQ
jgi:hypothetical protein